MMKALKNMMHRASASAACADAASACAHTAAFRVVVILDAIVGNCVLAVLGILVVVLAVLLVCGEWNPSEARRFA